jgi:Leucine-rich repeat (LRR) protein
MSQCTLENDDKWLSLEGAFTTKTKKLQFLNKYNRIEKLSLTNQPLLTAKLARNFSTLQSVGWMWLWCSVTKTAVPHIITIPDLERLDILQMKKPGKLRDFEQAKSLKEFRCNHYMSEADILEIAKLPELKELGAQGAAITERAIDALLQMPKLERLDLEGSELNDAMVAVVAESKTLTHLDVGASKLTSTGLKKVCEMSQLRSLDIWATNIAESDLDLLSNLSNLEFLSIGGYDDQTVLTAKGVLPRLKAIPSLKRIWLDGIHLAENEKRLLIEEYEYARLSP